MDNRLKDYFIKFIEKSLIKDEPLNSYLCLLERRWIKRHYNRLFPRRDWFVAPQGIAYRDNKRIKTGGTFWM